MTRFLPISGRLDSGLEENFIAGFSVQVAIGAPTPPLSGERKSDWPLSANNYLKQNFLEVSA
jgi:hypothetical protein